MIWPWETPVAVAAFEWLGTCMFPVMACQLVGSGEPPLTAFPRTLVRLLTCKHNTAIFSHSHIFFNHALRCGKQMEKKNYHTVIFRHNAIRFLYRFYFSRLGRMLNTMQDARMILSAGLPTQKQHSKRIIFFSLDLNLRKKQ